MADDDSQGDGVDIVTIAVEMYDSLCEQEARVSEVYHSVDFCIASTIWSESSDRSQRNVLEPRCRITSSVPLPPTNICLPSPSFFPTELGPLSQRYPTCSHDHADSTSQTMALGDFVAELREYDLTSPTIDQVLQYLISMGWVQVWRDTEEDDSETWITAIVAEDVDGDSGSEQAGGEGENGVEDGVRWS